MRAVDRTGIEIIDRGECLALLAGDVVGRIGIVVHGAPLVLPVNYVLDGEAIVFRTGPGSKLATAERAPACFEIDGFDRPHRAGWSVVVSGRLDEVTRYNGDLFVRASHLPVHPWADGPKDHLMRLVPATISGRRIRGDG